MKQTQATIGYLLLIAVAIAPMIGSKTSAELVVHAFVSGACVLVALWPTSDVVVVICGAAFLGIAIYRADMMSHLSVRCLPVLIVFVLLAAYERSRDAA